MYAGREIFPWGNILADSEKIKKLAGFSPQEYFPLQYSISAKRALILELTCPNEDRFETSHVLKENEYLSLRNLIIANDYDCNIFTIEVGVRGNICKDQLNIWTRHIGAPLAPTKALFCKCTRIARQCSYVLFQTRNLPRNGALQIWGMIFTTALRFQVFYPDFLLLKGRRTFDFPYLFIFATFFFVFFLVSFFFFFFFFNIMSKFSLI